MEFHRDFLLIKKGNGDSNIFCKFQLHSMQIFFKMARFSQVTTTPIPAIFDGLPYPT